NNHRVLLADGETWRRLDELKPGDRIAVSGGGDMWASEEVRIHWIEPYRATLDDAADRAGVSQWTVIRHRAGKPTRNAPAIAAALEEYERPDNQAMPLSVNRRAPIRIPVSLGPELGAFIGYLIGDGHISRRKRNLGLTT